MFARKKRNKSGSVSVQIVDKSGGYYKVVQSVGSSHNKDEIERLWFHAQRIIHADAPSQQWLFPVKTKEDLAVENFVHGLTNAQVRTIGPELIFGALFDRIGFNAIEDELFRHFVIARLAYPTSKLKTIEYLERYRGLKVTASSVYRFLDKLASKYKDQVTGIAYKHTQQCLKTIAVVFYDMTTLYFEAEDEDDLRKIGFSKDGKFQNPQILLGLLVGEQGLPIDYDIFDGNTFEGHTLLPVLKKIQEKYNFKRNPIVVADAALLSKDNIKQLGEQKYQFIIGARIKNESENVQAEILKQATVIQDGEGFVIRKVNGIRLAVTYSQQRAKKDAANRVRGLKKLASRIKSGLLTKQSLQNRGYNRFLTIEGKATISIDEAKVKQDERWDGLKGYITNTQLPVKNIVDNYVHLWQIEKAFRISKTDLRIRPVHHRRRQRIEAHISIAFAAYSIYKKLESLLKQKGMTMSPKRAAELTNNMYLIHYNLPISREQKQRLLKMDEEQQLLYDAIYQ